MQPVLLILLTATHVQALQGSRIYEAPRAPSPISLDGALEDSAWARAPWTEDFVDILGFEAPAPVYRTRAKVLWDDEYLYVGAEIEEPHLWGTLTSRDAIVYRDDDFEVFLDPDGDGKAYYEIEVNALGTVLDLFMDRPYKEGGRATIDWDLLGLSVAVQLAGTLNDPSDQDRGWSVEMAIPWTELVPPIQAGGTQPRTGLSAYPQGGGPPRPGDTWRFNFSRVDWPLEILEEGYRKATPTHQVSRHPEANWVWSPQGAIDMHIPSRWGVVRFASDPQNSPLR